jgi:hypothetical protein
MTKLISLALVSLCFISCSGLKSTVAAPTPKLKLLNAIEIPPTQEFKNTLVGGLSGIDYDAKNELYYIISDDRSMYNVARFYTAKINIAADTIAAVDFKNVVSFKNEAGENYSNWKEKPANSIDPEDIRYNPKNKTIVWSSEGARLITDKLTVLQNPTIQLANANGEFVNQYSIPANLVMQKEEKGPRSNGVLEGISFDKKYRNLYSSLEIPLYEDDTEATTTKGGLIRIYKYDAKSMANTAQYAYNLDPVAHEPDPKDGFFINGVSAIQYYNENQLLVVERSYSVGKPDCTIKVFLCDLTTATDVKDLGSLEDKNYSLASKKLVLNMDDLGVFIDNVEGITLGPKLANGKQSLIFVTDNNFSKSQKTLLYLFEIE